MGSDYAVFLPNTAAYFQAPTGLRALQKFSKVEVQAEFKVTFQDGFGQPFADNEKTPVQWLADEAPGCEVWLYFNPWWPSSLEQLGKPRLPAYKDQYWLRRKQVWEIEARDWYLRDRDGEIVLAPHYQTPLADAGNPDYIDWLAEELVKVNHPYWRLDVGFVWPERLGNRSRDEWNEGAFRLYDLLRMSGCNVVVNAAWEMEDPDAEEWECVAMKHVNGCMVEGMPGAFTWKNKGWYLWDAGLERLNRAWKDEGKHVVVIAKYKDGQDSRFETFEEHARHYHELGKKIGVTGMAIVDASGGYSGFSQAWWFDWMADDYGGPDPVVEVAALRDEIKVLRGEVVELSKIIEEYHEWADTADRRIGEVARTIESVRGAWNA